MLHKRVAGQFRKTAFNFHYEFNIRHMAGVFQGMLMSRPEQINDALKLTQLWMHESERTYCDRLVNLMDQKKYKELALEQAKKCAFCTARTLSRTHALPPRAAHPCCSSL